MGKFLCDISCKDKNGRYSVQLYQMRNRLVFYEDVNKTPVRAAGHLYSTRSKADYTYKQPVATRYLGKRASPPSHINKA